MITHLHREIEKLKKKILYMGAEVEESLRTAVDSLLTRNVKLAEKVIQMDESMDQLEVEIEEECLKILALHQPVATDLRYVVATLKINSDLERIGDLSVNIAERAIFLSTHSKLDIPLDYQRMADLTQLMLKNSLDALVNMDTNLARQVRTDDDAVDLINKDAYDLIEEYIQAHPENTGEALHLLSATRHLERIADGATNIAEDVIYMVEGAIVRHRYENEPPEIKD